MNTLPTQTELVTFNTGEVAGKWFARVKNTENGRLWIQRFREKNRTLKVTIYGRSPNRKSRCTDAKRRYYPNFHSASIAETIVVYTERNARRCEDIKVNEYITFTHRWETTYKVSKVWTEDNVKFLVAECYDSAVIARWSDNKKIWVEMKVA
jgi:hypothetical protein